MNAVLVTFKTSATGDITMFGSAAVPLLKMMGQSGHVPGALMAEDIAPALEKLKAALAEQPDAGATAPANEPASGPGVIAESDTGHVNVDDDETTHVALSKRATPLIGLLEAARDANANVLWSD